MTSSGRHEARAGGAKRRVAARRHHCQSGLFEPARAALALFVMRVTMGAGNEARDGAS